MGKKSGSRIVDYSKAEHGQGLIEYALLAGLVALSLILFFLLTGERVANVFCRTVQGLGWTEICSVGCFDDFSDDAGWEKVRGRQRIKDGQMCSGPGESRTFSKCSMDFPFDNYTVTINGATLFQGDGYGVFFRATDPKRVNGYTFQYDPGYGGGAFVFRKWVHGREMSDPIAVTKVPGFDWNKPEQQIQVRVRGDTFTAFVDGKEVLSASDDTYKDGGVGLRTWDKTEACFDSMTIR